MSRIFTIFILLAILSVNPAFSKDAELNVFPQSEKVLKALVNEKADGTTNHLYVSPVKKIGKDEFAWVYWKEKRQLILWEPFDTKQWKLSLSRRTLNLDKDVVPAAEDIKGSTYLVDEDWACRTIGDCMKNGREYIIQK
jgi:hypothetical protein